MDKESIWWNYVSGAVRYLNDSFVATSNSSLLLLQEGYFMEQFLHNLLDKLMEFDSGLHMEVGFAEEWTTDQDPGEFLMNRYAAHMDYHPLDGSRAEFLAKNNLLVGRLLVVRRVERNLKWLDFAVEYAKNSTLRNGLLILTYSGASPLSTPCKGVAVQGWDTYFSYYDMQLFASYCLADRARLSATERTYVTQVASRLAGSDPELCSLLAAEVLESEALTADAEAFWQWLSEYGAGSSEKSVEEIESILWESQIQTVFPIIEQTRRRYIETYYEELQDVLPQSDEFGNVLEDPKDMELRHMWHYFFKPQGFRNVEEKRAFQMAYEARNALAHLKLLNKRLLLGIFALGK